MSRKAPTIELFYSYAHADEPMRKKLEKHLATLHQQGLIASWHDRMIGTGTEWEQQIDEHLNRAQIILLLISANFLASPYCSGIEMKRAMERHKANEARVIPVILRPVHWKDVPFAKLQMLPTDGKPIASSHWHNQDEAFTNVAVGIRKVIDELNVAPEDIGTLVNMPLPSRTQTSPSTPIIWNVPYRRNPFFTGREDVLQQLHEYFAQATTAALTQPPAITGLGGIGKTQVAVEYAYRYKEAYHSVLWVNATSRETLIEGFVTIARLLSLPAKDEQDQSIIVVAVQQWLATHSNWLLILDNADDSQLVTEFLPTGNTGHLLLTTREQAWGVIARNFIVKKMDETEGILFLLRRANVLKSPLAPISEASSAEQTTAAAIVKEMDGLPLALDQAGAYIEETPSTLDAYLKAYQRRQTELLHERGKDQQYQHKSVATTWSLNFEQVEQLNPTAADLLRFLAFLAPDAIPEEMIVAGASELGPQFQALVTDETLLDQPIKVLSRFSFVQRDTDKHLLFIHRLVQAVLRANMTRETQRKWAERTVRAVNLAYPDVSNVNLWAQCERVLPHALTCAKLIEDYTLALPEAARLLKQTGYYLIDHAQYEQAKPLYERALAIRGQVLGPNHPDTAQSLNNLAFLYYYQGDYEQAKLLYERALAIREQVLGPNHPTTASSLNNLALLYNSQGDYERALVIREQVLGLNHPDTASSLNNLAHLYESQGDYEQAKPLYERALAIREQVLGPNHPNTASSLNNLAAFYKSQGDYEQAKPLYEHALAIIEKTFGSNHPNTKIVRENLATLLVDMKKTKK